MTAETIHTCSYECDRPECIRAQRDELASRLTTETSNARGDVRAVLQEMRDRQVARRFKSQTLTDWANRIESALASEGVHCDSCNGYGVVVTYVDPYERGDVSSPEQSPCPDCAEGVHAGEVEQQPEARGAVDEAWMQTARELYDRCRLWPESTDDGFMALLELRNHVQTILAALTGERNG